MNIPPLNYTMLSDFWNCPKKCYHARIAKDLPPERKSDAQLHGIEVHEAFEQSIKVGEILPSIVKHAALLQPLLPYKPHAELKLGMTADGSSATFFGKPFMRGVADVAIVNAQHAPTMAMLVDWKTGKVREDKKELECQAILLRANFPTLQKITGCYGWLVENRMGQAYDLSSLGRPYAAIHATHAEMTKCLDTRTWPENPNPLCGWCPVKACKYNRSE